MNTLDLYQEAVRRGLRLEPRGDKLAKLAVIPGNRVPPDFTDLLREHKAELLEWLSRRPCPGWQAVPPMRCLLVSTMPRPTAPDRERVLAYLLRQWCDRPAPLTAWLVLRGSAYYDDPGRTWDCSLICYAAARDAACWQLSGTESKIWRFLEATAETWQSGQAEQEPQGGTKATPSRQVMVA